MKTTALLFALLLTGIFACKDDVEKGCDANFLEAEVNNVLWQPPSVTAFNSGPGGNLTIQAKADYGQVREIIIQMPSAVDVGDYPLQTGLFTQSIIVAPGAFQAEIGQLTISEHDKNAKVIRGTFYFSIPSENLEVLNGSFCAKY